MKKDFYTILLSFQNYMNSLDYLPRRRESLVSPIFKTTFTLSGGPDLALDFLEGDKSLIGNYYIHQPCIRHWDSKQVGDGKHLSFFNMLVTTSIQADTRKTVFAKHYKYLTEYLKLDLNKMYATYFGGGNVKGMYFEPDVEAKNIWLSLGIPENRIIPCEEEKLMEAFVANSVEPVGGYRSELFYDLHDNKPSTVTDFFNLEEKGELLEFWTHVDYTCKVFVDKDDNYSFEKSDDIIHAAGFGPQRIMKILESVNCIEDISIFDQLKQVLPDNKNELARTVIIDHIRGLVFLINDGAADLTGKKNRSRKYVFRKYVEHLKNNLNKIVPEKKQNSVVSSLVEESISLFSVLFPEFTVKKNEINKKALELLS